MTEQPIVDEMSAAPRSKRTGLIIAFAVILALLALLAWGLKKYRRVPSKTVLHQISASPEQKGLNVDEYQLKRRALLCESKATFEVGDSIK